MNWLSVITGPITGIVQSVIEGRDRKRQLEHEIHLQRIENVRAGKIAEVEWNKRAHMHAGWVTDWVTILLSVPLILSFVPSKVEMVREGFAALQTMPIWYRAGIGLMIGFAYGYRKYADWQMSKHYTLPGGGAGGG